MAWQRKQTSSQLLVRKKATTLLKHGQTCFITSLKLLKMVLNQGSLKINNQVQMFITLSFASHYSDTRPCTNESSRLDPQTSKASQNTFTFHQGASVTKPSQRQQELPCDYCVHHDNSNSATTRQQTAVRDCSGEQQALEGACKLPRQFLYSNSGRKPSAHLPTR